MAFIVRTVEGNTSRAKHGAADFAISAKEASAFFAKRRSAERELSRPITLSSGVGHSFAGAMEAARGRLLEMLKKACASAAHEPPLHKMQARTRPLHLKQGELLVKARTVMTAW